jgi:tetratricopeptide (TPR) repeat protein
MRAGRLVLAVVVSAGCGCAGASVKPDGTAATFDLIDKGNRAAGKGNYDAAIADFTAAIELDRGSALAFHNRGVAWAHKGDLDQSLADLDAAVRLDPGYAVAFKSRGVTRARRGEFDKAVTDYTEAIRLSPQFHPSFVQRGNAWAAKGEYAKAAADYDEAIRINPGDNESYGGRAWLRATCPDAKYRDGPGAVADAKRGCEWNDWNDARHLAIYAAACAEAGRFDEAVRWVKAALKDEKFAERDPRAKQALGLYEAKKPFRDGPANP